MKKTDWQNKLMIRVRLFVIYNSLAFIICFLAADWITVSKAVTNSILGIYAAGELPFLAVVLCKKPKLPSSDLTVVILSFCLGLLAIYRWVNELL